MKSTDKGSAIVIDKPFIAAFEDTALRDPRLSWKAKGIAAYLLSKPPGWQIWTNDLINRAKDGRDAVRAGLAELEALGYLTRERVNGEGGRLEWRKRMSARPSSMWGDDDAQDDGTQNQSEPSTGFPSMVAPPSPGFPSPVKPSPVNPPHSITQSSFSNSREEEEAEPAAPMGAPAAEAAPAAQKPITEGLTLADRVAAILAECGVKVPPETLLPFGFEHILSESVRFWNETNHHERARSSGLLVYRIRNRKFKPLTDSDRAGCGALARWLSESPTQAAEAPAPEFDERPAAPQRPEPEPLPTVAHEPGAPVDAWLDVLAGFEIGSGTEGNQFQAWMRSLRLSALSDDGQLTLYASDTTFLGWAAKQFAPRVRRSMSVALKRQITVQIVAEPMPDAQAAA